MSVALLLDGKVALITGGSRGIGAAAVRMFVQAGARVAFNYQKAEAEAQEIVEECGAENCIAIKCNLDGTKTAERLVQETLDSFGYLNILDANHGIWPPE